MSTARHYEVRLTAGAEQDLDDIVGFIAAADSLANAEHVLSKLLEAADALAVSPHRGAHPRELLDLGIRQYRQTFFKPYRLIYQIVEQPRAQVIVMVIADGRRDMRALLERRLLRV